VRQADGRIIVAGGGSGSDFVVARYLPDGPLDPGFGSAGVVTTDFAGELDRATSVAIQADGKVVVAGSASVGGRSDFAVARYLPDGALDAGFGVDGKLTLDFAGSGDQANALAIQSDGKLVLAGSALVSGSERDVALARLNPDGSPDGGFGSGGKVTTDAGGADNVAHALAAQSDGKLILAGAKFTGYKPGDDMLALRYTPTGALDAGFGAGGVVTVDFAAGGDTARAVAVQGDGKILLGGSAFTGAAGDDFALARLNPNGSLDADFSGDGKQTTDFAGADDHVHSLAIAPNGDVLAAGRARGASEDFALARYKADGSLDMALDGDGRLTTDFAGGADEAAALLLLPDARFILVGKAGLDTDDFALARYNSDGSPDATFDGDGKTAADFALGQSLAYAVAQQGDGKLVVAGAQRLGRATGTAFTVTRLLPSGALDPAFGVGGAVTVDFGATAQARALAVQPDGKVIVAGSSGEGPASRFALARLNGDASLDPAFGSGGKVTTTFAAGPSFASAVMVQADGKIVVTGAAGSGPGDFAFARYNADGLPDTSFSGDGLATVDINTAADAAWALALQSDGKIIAAGYAYTGVSSDFALVRLNSDGSLDSSFDGDGKLMTDYAGANSFAYGVAVLGDGRIAAAGEVETNSGDVAVAVYHPDGAPDLSFDTDGRVTGNFGSREAALALADDDDSVMIAGRKQTGDGRDDFLAARYRLDGALDTSFGAGGAAAVDFPNSEARSFAMALQPDAAVVLAGEAGNLALARLLGRPSLEVSIAVDGADLVLSWEMSASATTCEVWRAAVPYFAPEDAGTELAGAITPCGPGATSWRDANRSGDAAQNWTYRVRTVGLSTGNVSSAGDGEFDFALVK
jgi:uncharacterized delta-60 repeat protein